MRDDHVANASAPLYQRLRSSPLSAVRAAIRSGQYQGHTAGLAPGRLQCNVVILPEQEAAHFLDFARANPKPCPIAFVSKPGDPIMSGIGSTLDIRTDVPLYYVYRHGKLLHPVDHVKDLWRDDFVAFALGCSFTFERALTQAGMTMRHIELNQTVPMFRTNIETVGKGPFGGGIVVSMRPIAKTDVDRVIDICERYPLAHGAPVHVGDAGAIGIHDIQQPDWGCAVPIHENEVPVFWACGVTPQAAIIRAALPLSITHAPGAMLITDVDEFARLD